MEGKGLCWEIYTFLFGCCMGYLDEVDLDKDGVNDRNQSEYAQQLITLKHK